MNRLATLAAAALLLGGLGAFAVGALAAKDPSSAFAAGGPGAWPLVSEATSLGLEARRIVSTPAAALADGGDPRRTLLAVVDSPRPFTAQEAKAVQDFLEAGGRVLLADPFGHAGTLGAANGVHFQRVRLVDPDPNATARLDGATFHVRWSNPSALQVAQGTQATVLAASSPGSFLDRDGNGTIDAPEPRGSFAVAVEVPVGGNGGLLVAMADAGPLQGPTAEAADNPMWRHALLSHLLPDGGRLLVDESRQPTGNPLAAALATAFTAAALQPWSWALAGLAILLLLLPLVPVPALTWGPHRFDPHRFIRRAAVAQADAAQPSHGTAWTHRGTVALCGCVALLLLGLVFASPTAAGAGALLAVALAGALLQPPPRLAALRSLTRDRPAEGAPVDVALAVSTPSRWTSRVELLDALPPEFALTAGSNWVAVSVQRDSPAHVQYTFTPSLRGPHRVGPLSARTMDPLGLRAAESVAGPAATVLVAPRQESVRRIPFSTRVPTVTLGPHNVNRAGDGSEFHALRDYEQGDSLRSVNWKASARAGGLIVNQRVHESMTRLTLLLDARAISGVGPAASTPLADGCRAALSIAAGALRVRDRIRFVAYGDGLTEIPEAPGSRQV
ncbi:MAG TPA: DUF4350 domain-containing protein, partial [Candidatus Thermoplasmatota archaeon]|nr:DUF4350 domain-containing protein [Candidatus Thermoplasmatota archaeon]